MSHQPTSLVRYAIFRDQQLVEHASGNVTKAKARLERFAHISPDHDWSFVTYDPLVQLGVNKKFSVH